MPVLGFVFQRETNAPKYKYGGDFAPSSWQHCPVPVIFYQAVAGTNNTLFAKALRQSSSSEPWPLVESLGVSLTRAGLIFVVWGNLVNYAALRLVFRECHSEFYVAHSSHIRRETNCSCKEMFLSWPRSVSHPVG